jgi:hypothetical protein
MHVLETRLRFDWGEKELRMKSQSHFTLVKNNLTGVNNTLLNRSRIFSHAATRSLFHKQKLENIVLLPGVLSVAHESPSGGEVGDEDYRLDHCKPANLLARSERLQSDLMSQPSSRGQCRATPLFLYG